MFLLGAGFNCSILDPSRDSPAPLARNFFQVFLADRRTSLDLFRQHVFVDVLLEEIARYWHLDLEGLRTESFDIEEWLTLFESQADDASDPDVKLRLLRARFALQQMLLAYLVELRYGGHTPTAQQFGSEILATGADVLTFNYDSLAEEAIRSASGIGPKPMPASPRTHPFEERRLTDNDLDASHYNWKPGLALGFQFDEIALPIAGVSQFVEGARHYAHAHNQLYSATRVLKLHGSTDWLRYTDQRRYPPFEGEPERQPGRGIVLEPIPSYRFGELPSRDVWQMEPIVIPPLQHKRFDLHPFPTIWETALQTLSECQTLIAIGYSFPPTDFRTRRLFLEAFSKPHLRNVVVINPDPAVAGIVRQLTHFKGAVVTCDDLRSLYGLPASWFDRLPSPAPPLEEPHAADAENGADNAAS